MRRLTPRWVGQEGPVDCVAAAWAMLTGQSLKAAKADFSWPQPDGEDRYCPSELWIMGERRGWKWRHTNARERKRSGNAIPGEVNLALVKVSESSSMYHAVVVLGDGSVLDPATTQLKRLSDYHHIGAMSAVDRCPKNVDYR